MTQYNGTVTMIKRERWRKPGNFYMEETTQFFSLCFIAFLSTTFLTGVNSQWLSARLRGAQGMVVFVHLVSIVWWLLLQASPSRRPPICMGHLPPQLDALSFSVVRQFLVRSNWLQECPQDGAASIDAKLEMSFLKDVINLKKNETLLWMLHERLGAI